jgi:cardiolipin synthase C
MRGKMASKSLPDTSVLMALTVVVCFSLVLSSCVSIPKDVHRPVSHAIPAEKGSPLNLAVTVALKGNSDQSGFLPLNGPKEALKWRLALIDNAQHSIDVQYFIWAMDDVGQLLAHRLLKAAQRGVRVRILVDDLGTFERDYQRAIEHFPNFEIRIFNPIYMKHTPIMRGFELLTGARRINHRMHNKMLVADNCIAVMGGRNIANEYFGLNREMNFRDFDMLTMGPVVPHISKSFDTYWNCQWSYPKSITDLPYGEKTTIQKAINDIGKTVKESKVLECIPWVHEIVRIEFLNDLEGRLYFGQAKVIYDLPDEEKGQGMVHMAKQMRKLIWAVKHDLISVSPYLIPQPEAITKFKKMTSRGIEIRLLTNSLASTDAMSVISAFSKYRPLLLEADVELHEYRPDPADQKDYVLLPGMPGRMGWHAKVAVFDHKIVYVGTMNSDPRSYYWNTEVGLIIKSKPLARKVYQLLAVDLLLKNSWQLELDKEGWVLWVSEQGSTENEPAESMFDYFKVFFLGLLPIEHLL